MGVRLFTPVFLPPVFLPPDFLPPDFLPLRLFTPTTFYPHIQFTSTAYSKSKNIIYIVYTIIFQITVQFVSKHGGKKSGGKKTGGKKSGGKKTGGKKSRYLYCYPYLKLVLLTLKIH